MGAFRGARKLLAVGALVGGVLSLVAVFKSVRPEDRPSILLISIDTLRADHLGCYGYSRATSPFIDSFAAEGMLFENAMVPAPDPGHASLLTGLHPLRHGLLTNAVPLAPEVETAAEVLRQRGYHTMGVTAVRHLSREYGFDQGFQDFSDERERESRPAPEVNAAAVSLLESHARHRAGVPFFMFVHYFDPHRPYVLHASHQPAEPIPARLPPMKPEDRDWIEAYDSEIRFVDAHVESPLRRLEALDLDRRLLVCILSDHGEQFGEHGFNGGHADFYRETVRIPLVCRGPGVPRGCTGRVVSSLDVVPWLMKAVGARFSGPIDGLDRRMAELDRPDITARDLLVLGYPSYTRSLQVVHDPWVFIRNLDHVYRYARVEPIRGTSVATLVRNGYREGPPSSNAAEDAVYEMPVIGLEPHAISAVVVAEGGKCDATLALKLEPRLAYLPRPLPFSDAVRIDYAVSRFDETSLVVSPRRCAGSLFFKFKHGRRGEVGPAGPAVVTEVFESLKTQRKQSVQDEIFNFRSDPRMLDNLIASPEGQREAAELNAELAGLFREYRRGMVSRGDRRDYEVGELEMLRSLGYVQ